MGNLDTPQILLGTAAMTWAVMGLALRKQDATHGKLSIALRIAAVFATIDLVSQTHLGVPLGAMLIAIATAYTLTMKSVMVRPRPATVESITTADTLDAEAQDLSSNNIMRGLRTPLTSVLAAVQLAEGCNDQDSPDATIVQLRTYGRQLAAAMSDIDDLGNLLRGRLEVNEAAFDLHELLAACITDITPTAREREVALRYEASPTLPRWVQGDANRLSQLFARVLQLSTVRCTIGPVDIRATSTDGQIHIALLNQHAGLEDPDGLGVMFARELAQALGGALQLRTRKDGGSEFHIQLPLKTAADWEIEVMTADTLNSSKPTSFSGQEVRGNVLLVTDNNDHQHLLAQVLSQSGAVVAAAQSREMALHVVSARSYDLILVDIESDNGTGVETARRLRSSGLTTPMLAMTSDCSTPTLEACLAAGCNGHLAKPIDAELLHGTLAMHLAAAD